jgi:hypothetical protein
MTTKLHSKRNIAVVAAGLCLVALAAVAFSACGGDDDGGPRESGIIIAITTLDKAGLHGIDTSISTDKIIPATARTTALQLQAVTLLTEWPKEMRGAAKALAAVFGEMAAALDGDKPDLAKAGAAVKKAHDAEHDFSHLAWDYLYAKAGINPGTEKETD